MLELLHPTSALCGDPFETAQNFIQENEAFDRNLFGGYIGYVNKNKADLYVNIRCAQYENDSLNLYAGAGITLDSNPEKELIETNNKLKTLLSLI